MCNMYKMIQKQPEAIQYAIDNNGKDGKEAAELMKNKRIYLTGCGSSFHAAIYGEFVLRTSGFDVQAVHALDMIHHTPKLKNSIVILISHSWKTRTTLKALDIINRNRIPSVGITANKNANRDVDVLLRTSNYYDESECVTMGYTTKLAALALIAQCNIEKKNLQKIPALIKDALTNENQIKELSNEYSRHKRFFFLGAGHNTATAYEMALKMKESNYTDTEAMEVEQMVHGSISGIDEGDVVFLIAPKDGKTRHRIYETAQALTKIGASTIAVTDDAMEIAKECTHSIKIGYIPEHFNPLLSIIPLQLFAFFIAKNNGNNPDMAREDDPRYRKAYAGLFLHLR